MSSVLKQPHYSNDQGRNGFDLGRRRIFSSPCGMLLPIFKDFASPGDKYKLNTRTFIRTEAVETAAFTRCKHYVDWFFVPMTQIMSRWNEFFNGTQDIMSAAYNTTGPTGVYNNLALCNVNPFLYQFDSPTSGTSAPVSKWVSRLTTTSGGNNSVTLATDEFGVPYAWNFRRLWDMLGYGSVDNIIAGDNQVATNRALLDFMAYHKIYHSHYNLTDWFPNNPNLYNIDDLYIGSATVGTSAPPTINAIRAVDILSTMHYRPFKKDYFTNIMPQPLFSKSFASFIPNGFNQQGVDVRTLVNPEVSPVFNGSSSVNSVSSVSDNGNSGISNGVNTVLTAGGTVSSYGISTGDIRSMFALDKLLRVTAQAGGHYEDQTLAHFGYKMPQGISKEAYYLGTQVCPIQINEVVATSTSGASGAGSVIGDIAGKGFGGTENSDDVNFTAPCHGIIMGISSISVDPDYASMGCETINRYSHTLDFYHPELENVGMQPLFGDFWISSGASNFSSLVGWHYRWQELKLSFDVVNEGFWNTSKASWTTYKQSIFQDAGRVPQVNPSSNVLPLAWRFFIAPQYTNNIFEAEFPYYQNNPTGSSGLNTLTYNVKNGVGPSSADWNGSWLNDANSAQNVYEYDNFLICMDIKAFKTSIMSTYSLPKML